MDTHQKFLKINENNCVLYYTDECNTRYKYYDVTLYYVLYYNIT